MTELHTVREHLPGDFFGGLNTRAAAWYDAIIDLMLADPTMRNTEIATRLGKHPTTVSTIVNSDTFRERFAARRRTHNEVVQLTLASKLSKVAELSLDLTVEVLERQRDKVPLKMLHEISTGTLDRLGYSPSARSEGVPGLTVQINNSPTATAVSQVASSDALAKAREHLARLQSLPRPEEAPAVVVEGEED